MTIEPLLYLLRTILVSAVLCSYYRFFLRDRKYHAFNRWYLLAGIPLAFLLPLIPAHLHLPWQPVSSPTALLGTVIWEGRADLPLPQGPHHGKDGTAEL